jgi:acetyltransferase-like isoleucine patch superfamily enzyme
MRRKSGRFGRRWCRLWLRWGGTGVFGRFASRMAALAAPPHLGQVSLAHMTARGYIDADAVLCHSGIRLGRHVYIAPRVLIYENREGGPVTLSEKVAIHRDAVLETGQGGYIAIQAGSSVHPGCQLKAYVEPILIGQGVMIAANAALYSYDHGMAADLPIRAQPLTAKAPIVIGDGAWIGTGAIILSGVAIGEGAVIGAGSVVTGDIPAGAIAVGNPARVIKHRSDIKAVE